MQVLQSTSELSRPRPDLARRRAFVLSLVVGAGLVATSAGIHRHLWAAGYRNLPTIGALFLLQAVAGFALAGTLLILRRFLVVLAAAAYMASTIAGFLISWQVGLFGFKDTFSAPLAKVSLVVETVGLVVLLACAALAPDRQRRPK
jgi:hypothetical protein